MEQTKQPTKNEMPVKKKILYIALFILSIYSVSCFQQLCYSEDDARYWYYRGKNEIDAQIYGEAKESFSKAIEINPNYEEAFFKRGEVYSALAEYEKAISDFTKVIELNPNNSKSYISRGYAYNMIEKYKKALSDYTYAIKLEPNNGEHYGNRGHSYIGLDMYDKAIEDFRRGCELGDFNACTSLHLYN